jgi:sarcosine oxidase subunit alpha
VEGRRFDLDSAPRGEPVAFEFEGQTLSARGGETVQVALLAHGVLIASRSVKYHRPRGPFCLAGSCGQCWMRIDDIPNRAACTTVARPGMSVARQNAFPSVDYDMFRASDFTFPRGLDHHTLGTTPFVSVNTLIGTGTRQMAGLGKLSEKLPEAPPPIAVAPMDLAVVGSGPAGIAACREAAGAGLRVVLIEARRRIGGQLTTGLFSGEPAPELNVPHGSELGVELWTGTTAIAAYASASIERPLDLLLRRRGLGSAAEQLILARPRAVILANGGYEQAPLVGSNDLPGLYGARALARLVLVHGIFPGRRAAIIDGGDPGIAPRLEAQLSALGIPVQRVPLGSVRGLKGRRRAKGLELAAGSITADVIAAALPPSPGYELAHQAGCRVVHRPERGGFLVDAAADTRETSVAGVYAAGDVCGASGAVAAAAEGRAAGRAARRRLGR